MTPRQLSAFDKLLHEESETHYAALASAVRAAHHSDKNGFEKYIRSLTQ